VYSGDVFTVQFFANNSSNSFNKVSIVFQGVDLSQYSTIDFSVYTVPTTYLYPIATGLNYTRNIKWNGIQFLALGDGGGYMSSNDGISWEIITNTFWENNFPFTGSSSLVNVTWDGTYWIGFGIGEQLGHSKDGINWVPVDVNGIYIRRSVENNLEKNNKVVFPSNKILLLNNISGGWVGNGKLTGVPDSDKKTWKEFDSPIKINQACWDGIKWVGVGNTGIAVSANGIKWNSVNTSIFNISGNSILFDGQKFVAVGQGLNSIAYSYDGYIWIPVPKSTSIIASGNRVFYDGRMYVAVGQGGNSIIYSYDGMSWFPVVNSSINLLSSANSVYSNGYIWIAIGQGQENTIVYSNDGVVWKGNGKNIFLNSGNGLGWNGQLWVAVGQGGNSIAYSNDGVSWFGLGNPIFSYFGLDVLWVGVRWIVTGSDNYYSLGYSVNGKDWRSEPNLNSNSVQRLSWNQPDVGIANITQPSLFLGTTGIAISNDGIFWNTVGTTLFSAANCAFWNGTLWVVGGQGSNTIAYSSDGISWTGLGNSIFTRCNCVSWNGTLWVAGGEGSNTIAYSYDGISWTGIGDATITTSGNSVIWTGTNWIMVGEGVYKIATSVDGVNWVVVSESVFTSKLLGVCISSDKIVAVGQGLSDDEFGYSLDGGATWTLSTTGVFGVSANSIFWNGEKYVTTGGSTNSIAYSMDGISWTVSSTAFSGVGNFCNSVSWNGKSWIATGSLVGTNVILYSYDGVNWRNSNMRSSTGYGVASNPKIGATYVSSSININPGQRLKYTAPKVYDRGIRAPTDISAILQN